MRNGNLEMDLNDGEVRYKTYLYAKDRIPAQNEIERYVDISFLTLDRYAEGIMKILYADMDDKAAVEQAVAAILDLSHSEGGRRIL